jgi:putative RNA 2'-phosphotransferase
MSKSIQHIKNNAKIIQYILGHRPDEFGLVLDEHGFIKIKTLIKALHEDVEWRFMRMSCLKELVLSLDPPPIEINGALIRATDRRNLPVIRRPSELPKLLFSSIRRRAYPVVMEKGLTPGGDGHVILVSNRDMAVRLGRRIDNDPVILAIQTAAAQSMGGDFEQYGRAIYLADVIPVGTFTGPPLPKEREKPAKTENPPAVTPPISAGSYFPDITENDGAAEPRRRGQKEKTWQKERRWARKHKRKNKAWSE